MTLLVCTEANFQKKKTLPLFQQLPLADEDGPERGEVHQ